MREADGLAALALRQAFARKMHAANGLLASRALLPASA
jgi:hypothetical protein